MPLQVLISDLDFSHRSVTVTGVDELAT